MKATRFLIAAAIMLMFAGGAARADFQRVLNFQGRLTDNNGVPVADGAQNVIFNLCTDAACTAVVWTEGPTSVTFTDGLFSVVLGASTSLSTVDFNSTEYYLRVTIGATTYTPTQRVTGAAFAMNVPDSSITSAKVNDNSLTASDLAVNVVSSVDGVTNDGGDIDFIAGTGISITPNDAANTITISTVTGGSDPFVDVVGDTMTGTLVMSTAAGDIVFTSSGSTISNNAGGVNIGGAGLQIATGTLGVGGAATMASTLVVSGAATMSSTLNVVGAATLNSTLALYGALTGSSTIQGTRLISTVTTGTAPLSVTSTTLVSNLNADLLDGYDWTNVPNATDIWVNETGDTMTGALAMSGAAGDITFDNAGGTITNSAGAVMLSDDVQISSSLYTGGAATFNSTVGIVGAATTTSTLSVGTDLTTGGDVTINGYDLQMVRGDNSYIHKLGRISFDWTAGTYNDSSFHGIESENEAGTLADSLRINSYSDIINTIDSNANSTSYFKVQKESTTNGTDLLTLDESGNFYVLGDISSSNYTTLDGRYVNVGGDTMTGTLTMSSANIAMNTAYVDFSESVMEKVLWYGAAGTAGSYTTGIESNTLYSKANRYHRWYGAVANADGGASDKMELDTGTPTQLTVNGNILATGTVYIVNGNTALSQGGGNALRVTTNSGYIELGPQNATWAHIQTDRASFYFNTKVTVNGNAEPYTDMGSDLGAAAKGWANAYFGRYAPQYTTWSGIGDGGSAIVNSNEASYQALMIVGSDQGTGRGRWVRLWDYLTVQGNLEVTGNVYGTGINCVITYFAPAAAPGTYCPANHSVVAAMNTSRQLMNPESMSNPSMATTGYMICCPTSVNFP